MALNATIGAVDTNSYVTQAEATAYFDDRMHASAWIAFNDKDKVLITASQMLDWFFNWKGTKASSTQFMQWPRSEAYRPDGTLIVETILPPELKIAVYELALVSLSTDRMQDDPLAGIGELKAGSLKIKAGPEKPNQTNKKSIPQKVHKILSEISNRISVVRLLRA